MRESDQDQQLTGGFMRAPLRYINVIPPPVHPTKLVRATYATENVISATKGR
jgi:hypothetical protein